MALYYFSASFIKLVLMYLKHFSFIFDSLLSVFIHLDIIILYVGLDCDHSSH
uniref:Uncharacterized protein n=1 Tax=Arundo donax TaxID=35708 RepID=A0A0A9DCT1_ARUDO